MGMVIMNGVEYSSSPKDGFPPLIYSDEEREVGVWRDGKPLYQRSYSVTGITDGTDKVVDSDFSGKTLVKYEIDFNGIVNTDAKFASSNSDTLYINSNNQLIYYLRRTTSWWAELNSAIITVFYTKTTDVAGSGKYTTYGGLTHHYSTTEKVVGTYLGKPLYERTYSGLSISGSLNNYIHSGIIISDIEKVVSVPSAIDDDNQSILMKIGIYTSNKELALFEVGSATRISEFTIQYTKTTD